jgi:phage shock protein PspC (stress-responsive transcriptional regulator)
MNRVTIVNLAGRAWHVEEEGAEAIDAWLRDARTRLAADPDVDELLLDFERAIADRCASVAPDVRDVVTSAQVREMLEALGTVEPADASTSEAPTEQLAATQAPSSSTAGPPPPRKLYRLTGPDESMVGGVCSGIAAYFNVDVTVVRVLAVVLAFVTSGVALLVYVAMWLLVPEAVTPEQRAQARRTGVTAEEMLARARESASPALTRAGSILGRIGRTILVVVRGALLLAILVLLASWAFTIGWLFVDGDDIMGVFDPGTSTWLVALWISCISWVPLAILLLLDRGLAAVSPRRGARDRRVAPPALVGALVATLVLAALGVAAIPASNSEQLRDVSDGHGTITIGDTRLCVDTDRDRHEIEECDAVFDDD